MAFAGKIHADSAVFKVPVLERQAAGGMVGSDDDERMPILCRPLKDIAYGAVKVQKLLHRLADVISVQPVVDAGAFQHHHKAVPALRKKVQATHDCMAVKVPALRRNREVVRSKYADDGQSGLHEFVLREGYGIARGGHFLSNVAPVSAFGREPVQPAAGEVVHSAFDIIGNKIFLIVAVFIVAGEVAGRCIGKMAGDGDAGLLAEFAGLCQYGRHVGGIGSRSYVAVACLYSGGDGRPAGTGIRYELVGAIGPGKADGRETVKVQFPVVEHPCAANLLQPHAVADHYDDVLHFVCHRRHLNLRDVVGERRLIVLEWLFFRLFAGKDHGRRQRSDNDMSFHE